MSLWFVLGLMTVIAAFAVLWPLGRAAVPPAAGDEAAIYRDQLAEIERDRSVGLIERREAEAARIEVSRRLIAAAEADQNRAFVSRPGLRRALALATLIVMPLLAGTIYLRYGSPGAADQPLASRMSPPAATASLDNLVMQVEQHLEKNPRDGRGWEVLAPVLLKLGRYDDAVRAFRNALAYNGESATRHSNLGEAIGAAANGVITAEAKAEFERARALDAKDAKARYFLGLAAQQDGKTEEAAAIWQDLLTTSPPDAPWRNLVENALASVGGKVAPALPDEEMTAARAMSPEQRSAFIQSMVDRLAARLKQNGDDAEGWLRLIRAYIVLGDRDRARAAVSEARSAINGEAARKMFDERLKDVGVDG